MKELKTENVRVRLTKTELNLLDNLVNEINSKPDISKKTNRNKLIQCFIRNAVDLSPAFLDQELEELKETNKNLLAIGRNLNQITRKINSGHLSVDQLTEDYLKNLVGYIVQSRKRIVSLVEHNKKRGQTKYILPEE